jgi:lambda family phage minor tail protein L
MTNLAKELQSLDVESPIDLITVTATSQILRFCNLSTVNFQGLTYLARPCEISWLGQSGEGTELSSKLSVSDIDGVVGILIDNYEEDVIGASVNVKRTLKMFLDGESSEDPTQFVEFSLRINSWTGQYGIGFEFNLIPLASLERRKIPGRTYLRRCGWEFRDSNCAATTALNFDIFGNATTLANSVCGKDLDSCGRYQNILRYGGFPGIVRNN